MNNREQVEALLGACWKLLDVIGDIDSGRPRQRSTWIKSDEVVAARKMMAVALDPDTPNPVRDGARY